MNELVINFAIATHIAIVITSTRVLAQWIDLKGEKRQSWSFEVAFYWFNA